MKRTISVNQIDRYNEIRTVWVSYPTSPLVGINGKWDDDMVLPFYDIDAAFPFQTTHFELDTLPLPFFILKTDHGYHYIGLVPMPMIEWLQIGVWIGADRKFLGYTLIRGYTTLRISLKENGKPSEVIGITGNRTEKDYSATHLDHLPIDTTWKEHYRNLCGKPLLYTGDLPVYEIYR